MHLLIVASNFCVRGEIISGPEGAFWIILDKITKQATAHLGISSLPGTGHGIFTTIGFFMNPLLKVSFEE